MGRSASSSPSYTYAGMTMAEAVTAGDFVVNTPIGNCWADGSIGRPIFNPASSSLDTVTNMVTLSSSPANPGTQFSTLRTATLSNGNMVVAWMNSSLEVYFSIYSPAMALIGGPVLVGSIPGTGYDIALCALNGGGFAVAFATAIALQVGIYSNTGAVVSAFSTLDNNIQPYYVRMTAGALGNICILYSNGYTNYPKYAVISSAGAVVLAPTQALSMQGTSDGYALAVLSLPGGNFSLTMASYLSNTGVSNLVLSNAGVVVRAWLNFFPSANVYNMIDAIALSGGGYAVAIAFNYTTYYVYTFSASGAQLNVNSFASPGAINVLRMAALANNEFCLFYSATTTSIAARRFDTNGNNTAMSATVIASDNYRSKAAALPAANGTGAVLVYGSTLGIKSAIVDCSVANQITLSSGLNTLSSAGSSTQLDISSVPSSTFGSGISASFCAIFYMSAAGPLTFGIKTLALLRAVPVGISINNAAAAQTATVITSGLARLRTALTSVINVDATARGGIRISAASNSAQCSMSGGAASFRNIS